MCALHQWWGILSHSSLQDCFKSVRLEGFQALARLSSCHGITIGFKSGLWQGCSKTFILFLFGHSEVDFLWALDHCLSTLPNCAFFTTCFSLINWGFFPSWFSGREQYSWFHQLWEVLQVLEKESSTITTVLLVWCSFCGILCELYIRSKRTHVIKKVLLLTHQST